jgi:ElaB/YqjD/DUF883 family membrane-anchored ribosome-binding protein
MKVFFCWSGSKSNEVAELLGAWVGQVIQAVQPWISTGIAKGAKWRDDLADHLGEAKAGVVCLTRDNLDSPWIHFESGALAKTEGTRLFTFLLDLKPTDIKDPLAWFQATTTDEDDVRKFIHDLNDLVGTTGGRALSPKDIDEVFDTFWPRLKEKLEKVLSTKTKAAPARSEREILQETLQIVREIRDTVTEPPIQAVGLSDVHTLPEPPILRRRVLTPPKA